MFAMHLTALAHSCNVRSSVAAAIVIVLWACIHASMFSILSHVVVLLYGALALAGDRRRCQPFTSLYDSNGVMNVNTLNGPPC